MSLTRHTISFSHALSGLIYALSTQPNFLVHLLLSLVAVAAGIFFRLSLSEWLVIILTIFIGLVVELINTSIESAIDLLTDKYHIHAKRAKDTSAAAMLVYACGSVFIAAFIFFPKIWNFI